MPQLHLAQFEFEYKRRSGMILASATDSVASKHSGQAVPAQLKAAVVGKLPRQFCKRNPTHKTQHFQLLRNEWRKVGIEVHRTLSVLAGVLITSVAKVAQQLAGNRTTGLRQSQFHESFRLPWQLDRRENSRR